MQPNYVEIMKAAGADPKGPAVPEFFMEPEEQTFESKQKGRPIFKDVEKVRIWIPGDTKNCPVEVVNDEHKARWPAQYQAFRDGVEAPLEGTPLQDWPPIKASQIREFAHFHIRTVEDLAGLNDSHLQNLPMGARDLREQAKKFLDVARNGTAPIARMLAETQAKTDENDILKRQLEEANARIKELEGSNAGVAA